MQKTTPQLEKAYFGGGCFWCTEAIFDHLNGVTSVTSGYSGGKITNPNYERVSLGLTGHAEVIEIEFDPEIISYEQLLEVFFHTHNPTTLNQQGADVGTQYRSIILYTSEAQKVAAEKVKRELNEKNEFGQPIVTEIKEFEAFYPAENYHQEYFDKNQEAPYCQVVISPKVSAFMRKYAKLTKEHTQENEKT